MKHGTLTDRGGKKIPDSAMTEMHYCAGALRFFMFFSSKTIQMSSVSALKYIPIKNVLMYRLLFCLTTVLSSESRSLPPVCLVYVIWLLKGNMFHRKIFQLQLDNGFSMCTMNQVVIYINTDDIFLSCWILRLSPKRNLDLNITSANIYLWGQ